MNDAIRRILDGSSERSIMERCARLETQLYDAAILWYTRRDPRAVDQMFSVATDYIRDSETVRSIHTLQFDAMSRGVSVEHAYDAPTEER